MIFNASPCIHNGNNDVLRPCRIFNKIYYLEHKYIMLYEAILTRYGLQCDI